jgi:hypothetical protein
MLPSVRRALEGQRMVAGGSELVFPSRVYLEMLYREIERRGLEDAVTWSRDCGSDCESHEQAI